MITGYMQNEMVDAVEEIFNMMPFRNTISWAAMIDGYAQNSRSETLWLCSKHSIGRGCYLAFPI
jgi:pentatricopeptide repeat protein